MVGITQKSICYVMLCYIMLCYVMLCYVMCILFWFCISAAVFSKKNGWLKWLENNVKGIIEISIAYLSVYLR